MVSVYNKFFKCMIIFFYLCHVCVVHTTCYEGFFIQKTYTLTLYRSYIHVMLVYVQCHVHMTYMTFTLETHLQCCLRQMYYLATVLVSRLVSLAFESFAIGVGVGVAAVTLRRCGGRCCHFSFHIFLLCVGFLLFLFGVVLHKFSYSSGQCIRCARQGRGSLHR